MLRWAGGHAGDGRPSRAIVARTCHRHVRLGTEEITGVRGLDRRYLAPVINNEGRHGLAVTLQTVGVLGIGDVPRSERPVTIGEKDVPWQNERQGVVFCGHQDRRAAHRSTRSALGRAIHKLDAVGKDSAAERGVADAQEDAC